MAKGVSIKFKSYEDTIPKLLSAIKLDEEVKKHAKIVLKPKLRNESSVNTKVEFVEQVLKFCVENKNSDTEIFIAEGSDGIDTVELFEKLGYKKLAERYKVGLIDLNYTEVEDVGNSGFMKFEKIFYPKILLESFVISMPVLSADYNVSVAASLENMLGAFPAKYYKGFFSQEKTKIKSWPAAYSIHDVIRCKMPDFALIDASDKGFILAGKPLETDRQAAKILGIDSRAVKHLKLVEESLFKDAELSKRREMALKERELMAVASQAL